MRAILLIFVLALLPASAFAQEELEWPDWEGNDVTITLTDAQKTQVQRAMRTQRKDLQYKPEAEITQAEFVLSCLFGKVFTKGRQPGAVEKLLRRRREILRRVYLEALQNMPEDTGTVPEPDDPPEEPE